MRQYLVASTIFLFVCVFKKAKTFRFFTCALLPCRVSGSDATLFFLINMMGKVEPQTSSIFMSFWDLYPIFRKLICCRPRWLTENCLKKDRRCAVPSMAKTWTSGTSWHAGSRPMTCISPSGPWFCWGRLWDSFYQWKLFVPERISPRNPIKHRKHQTLKVRPPATSRTDAHGQGVVVWFLQHGNSQKYRESKGLSEAVHWKKLRIDGISWFFTLWIDHEVKRLGDQFDALHLMLFGDFIECPRVLVYPRWPWYDRNLWMIQIPRVFGVICLQHDLSRSCVLLVTCWARDCLWEIVTWKCEVCLSWYFGPHYIDLLPTNLFFFSFFPGCLYTLCYWYPD